MSAGADVRRLNWVNQWGRNNRFFRGVALIRDVSANSTLAQAQCDHPHRDPFSASACAATLGIPEGWFSR